jgi:hypothetical protein
VTEYAQRSNKHFGRFGRSLRHRVAAHAATPASLEALGHCVAVAVQALAVTPRRVTARRANNPGWQDRRFGGPAVTTELLPRRSLQVG